MSSRSPPCWTKAATPRCGARTNRRKRPGRLENLKELVRAVADFETLAGFLDHVSLVMENEENTVRRPGHR